MIYKLVVVKIITKYKAILKRPVRWGSSPLVTAPRRFPIQVPSKKPPQRFQLETVASVMGFLT